MKPIYRLLTFVSISSLLLATGSENSAWAESEIIINAETSPVTNGEEVTRRTNTIKPLKPLRIVTPEPLKKLAESGIYSTTNDSMAILQNPTEAMAKFPTNRRKEIDWVQTLEKGLIEPRASIDGTEEMVPMDMDIIMTDTASMPNVRFPHLTHTKWLVCENCHTEIFEPVNNGNPITMGKILKGEYCGRCHDRVAFSLFVCENCHNVQKK